MYIIRNVCKNPKRNMLITTPTVLYLFIYKELCITLNQ